MTSEAKGARPEGPVREAQDGLTPVRVLIIDDTLRTLENLKRLLAYEDDVEVVGTCTNALEGLKEARRLTPDVIITDVNMPELDGIQATQMFSRELPQIPVIIISVQDDREYLKRAMQSGAREYLIKPFGADEVIAAIHRVSDMGAWRRRLAPAIRDPHLSAEQPDAAVEPAEAAPAAVAAWEPAATAAAGPEREAISDLIPISPSMEAAPDAGDHLVDPAGPAADAETPEPEDAPLLELPPPLEPLRRDGMGQVTAIFSGKGGVGKTLLAINVAAAIAKQRSGDVALLDLDLMFGDVAVMLGIDPPGTISDVAAAHPAVDGPFVGRLMPETASGFRVLCSPTSPELAELVTAEHVRTTVEILRGAFENVIVDCGSRMDDVTLEALERADKILMVTDLNLPAIKDAKLALRVMEHLGIPRERIHLVLNRSDAPSDVTVEQLEANLKFPVSVQLPSQGKLVLVSIQKGETTVRLYPQSPLGLKFQQLGDLVLGRGGAAKQRARRTFWGRVASR